MSFTTNQTGGEYKHLLTKKEMPSHFHTTVKGKDDGSTPNISDQYVTYQSETSIPLGSQYSALHDCILLEKNQVITLFFSKNR